MTLTRFGPVTFSFVFCLNDANTATMIRIEAFLLPMFVFNTTCYFFLRTGGKILLTMGFDSLFVWAVRIPLALIFAKYTSVGVLMVVFISDAADVLKTAVGYILVDRGIWLNRMVE